MQDPIARGEHAENIINDPMVQEAFTAVAQALMVAWTENTSPEGRDTLWHIYRSMGAFRAFFIEALSNGKIEQARINEELQNMKDGTNG